MIQPLANRVLIKPDPPAKETEGGIVIPDNHRQDFEMSGTVVSIGDGPASARKVREATIARVRRLVEQFDKRDVVMTAFRRALDDLSREVASLSELQVGMRVAFPYTVGMAMEVDGERLLIMTEDQIVAILEEAPAHV